MNTIIIGGGPAGITSAIYLLQAGFKVLVIDSKQHNLLSTTERISNYYGFPEPISGEELYNRGHEQAKNLGIKIIYDDVIDINTTPDFNIKTVNNTYTAKSLLLATGKKRLSIPIPGLDKFTGKGISFCATCDGFLFKNKTIGIIGFNEYMVNELTKLLTFTNDITIFTNNNKIISKLPVPKDIRICNDSIKSINGSDHIYSVSTNNNIYKIDGLFMAIGLADSFDFANKLGIIIKNKNIVVDKNFMTNIPGLFAAGDCIGGLLQISKSVSDGANSAIGIIKYLKQINLLT